MRRRWSRARLAAIAVMAAALCGRLGWQAHREGAGDPREHLSDDWHRGHRVLDRDGELLRELPSALGLRGRPLSLTEVGDRLVAATLVAEDRAFFEHDGVDRRALARAIRQNVTHTRLVSGASTITQQLVKLLDGEGRPGERTLGLKLEELARAQNLEDVVGKEQILTAYLDRLPYGHGLVGPEAAARGYFRVASADLSWAQAAFLAVLPRAPSHLDPYRHPERVRLRQSALLRALHEQGHLSRADLDRALAEPVEPRALEHPFHAPHLVESLRSRGELAPGDETRTTLDLRLQRDVEGLVATQLAALADAAGGQASADDAAVLVVDNERGEVLAYVGSADFHDPEIAGQVDMVRARRQPGSTLKPFVYALWFEAGHSAAQAVPDVPTRYAEAGGRYDPRNFHRGFLGPISAREALAASLNVPPVRMTAELGVGPTLDRLRAVGLASLDRDAGHYGLSLALGSGEVTLWELAGAYATLARGGRPVELHVLAGHGGPVDAPPVMDPAAVALVTDALSDPLARLRLLHGRSPFDLGFPVAVKTGTSSGHRDTWAVGYTRERTVAVWVGRADGARAGDLTGAGAAGPLFGDAMRRAMRDVPGRAPLWDEGLLASVPVCPLSGRVAGPACPEAVSRRFAANVAPHGTCDVHRHVRSVRVHGRQVHRCDARARDVVAVLPGEYDAWLASLPPGAPGRDPDGIPWVTAADTQACGLAASRPVLALSEPLDGTVLLRDADGGAQVEVQADLVGGDARSHAALGELEILVDDRVVARADAARQARLSLGPGDHAILARPVDGRLAVQIRSVRVSVR